MSKKNILKLFMIVGMFVFSSASPAMQCNDLFQRNLRETMNTGTAKVMGPLDYGPVSDILLSPYRSDKRYTDEYRPFDFPHVSILVSGKLVESYISGETARNYRIQLARLKPEDVRAIDAHQVAHFDISNPVLVKTIRVPLTRSAKTWPIISLNINGIIYHLDLYFYSVFNLYFAFKCKDCVEKAHNEWRDGIGRAENFYDHYRGESGHFEAQAIDSVNSGLSWIDTDIATIRGMWEISGDFLLLRIESPRQQFRIHFLAR